MSNNPCHGALLGLAVGDALGVPVEFESRDQRDSDPVQGMREFGTHDQPAGTWSDDASLTFCLAESLAGTGPAAMDLHDVSQRFVHWLDEGYWTAHGKIFDVGIATRAAIGRLRAGISPEKAGGKRESDNGNGALMRILPLVFHPLWQQGTAVERQQLTQRICGLTHGHSRSTLACYFYLKIAWSLIQGDTPAQAHKLVREEIPSGLISALASEIDHYTRLLHPDFVLTPREEIQSSGYVVHTLEAALWCLLRGTSFAEVVLLAVNLGSDSDTTGAVVGGLAGIYFGAQQIPTMWLKELARRDDILVLADSLAVLLKGSGEPSGQNSNPLPRMA
ncbi:ADP-ribosylglycohydrolase family protein [Hymenobacter siberiensis]|uniref:ADP-ribosylglycohydrolase family protein n=1 Tax=Hymenobacter siberiensis TaxID=2848396 RepID=UPI001F3383D7|nr:ADP-ribosylglycohydrolase family protein [Hymenobacter siberiensis]